MKTNKAVYWAVCEAVFSAVHRAVDVAVDWAVVRAVGRAVVGSSNADSPHPALQDFLEKAQ